MYNNNKDIDKELAESLIKTESFIRLLSSINKNDYAIDLEDYMIPIFDIHFSTNFRNLNSEKSNFPGIDIYSDEMQIAIQITTNTNPKKKRTCVAKVKEIIDSKKLEIQIFYIFVLTTKRTHALIDSIDGIFNNDNILNISSILKFSKNEKELINDYINRHKIQNLDPVFRKNLSKHNELFIETEVFRKAYKQLETDHAVIFTGNAGTGKTMTSYALLIKFLLNGYKIIKDVSEIKKYSNESQQYIIFIDDVISPTDIRDAKYDEIEAIFATISQYASNHIKIIINTRTQIFKQYKSDVPKLNLSQYEKFILSVERLSDIEKLNILKIHLINSYDKKSLLDLFEKSITQLKINKILNHKNFNPRLIELFKEKSRIECQNLANDIIETLENPEKIYGEDYDKLSDNGKFILKFLWQNDGEISYNNIEKMLSSKGVFKHEIAKELAILEDSFIFLQTLMQQNNELYYKYNNPSIEDFCNKIFFDNVDLESVLDEKHGIRMAKKIVASKDIDDIKKIEYIRKQENQVEYLNTLPKITTEIFSEFKKPLLDDFIAKKNIPSKYETFLDANDFYNLFHDHNTYEYNLIYYNEPSQYFDYIFKNKPQNLVDDLFLQSYISNLLDYIQSLIDDESYWFGDEFIGKKNQMSKEEYVKSFDFVNIITSSIDEHVTYLKKYFLEFYDSEDDFYQFEPQTFEDLKIYMLTLFENDKTKEANKVELITFLSNLEQVDIISNFNAGEIFEYVELNIVDDIVNDNDSIQKGIIEFKNEVLKIES